MNKRTSVKELVFPNKWASNVVNKLTYAKMREFWYKKALYLLHCNY